MAETVETDTNEYGMMRAVLMTLSSRFKHLAVLGAVAAAFSCGPVEREEDGERAFMPPNPYPFDTARADTFRPNPNFVADPQPEVGVRRFALRQEGEVIVIEGDMATVTSGGDQYGISPENAEAIIQQILAVYPDEFDTIQLYPAFPDLIAGGSAYYSSIANSVAGIGLQVYNGRPDFGLPAEGRLSGWSNMNDIQQFSDFNSATLPKGRYYAVIAQELSHRWLMFLRFRNSEGENSDALLGRQDAHWSALVNAYGSCQDGVAWIDNEDGTFTHDGESHNGFAPFDKYAMGIIPPEATEPTFRIINAKMNNADLHKTSHSDLSRGDRVTGDRRDVSIEDVRLALGPRNPPAGTETPYYRVALVLVTYPGQPRTEWEQYLTTLQTIQETFPATWSEWTGGAGAICTKVSERCPEPTIGLESYKALDGGDNYLAPGESFELELALRNDGLGTAEDVRVFVSPDGPGVTIPNGMVTSPPIGEGSSALLPRIPMSLGTDVPCNSVVRLKVREETKEGPIFFHSIELQVGTKVERFDALEEAPDWRVNPEGTDTASTGAWALGQTEFVSLLGEVLQPAEDHTPGNGKLSFGTTPARVAGGANRGDVDRGKTTVESPVFALRGMRDPTLVFYAWHIAKDFTKQPPVPLSGADLVVRGTDDGGETWTEMTRLSTTTEDWLRVSLRIKDQLELTNKVKFRFEIEEIPPEGIDPLIEAAIDDISIVDYLEGCQIPSDMPDAGVVQDGGGPGQPARREESGCGCNTGGGASPVFGLFALVALLFLTGRRRR